MLENELLHSLMSDPEEKTVYVIDNDDAATFRRKADRRGFPYELIPEWKFHSKYQDIDRSKFNVVIHFNPMALHEFPDKLRSQVEEQVEKVQPFCDSVAVYYGMCGSFGWDIQKWAADKGFKPASTMKCPDGKVCDDCVGVAIGGGTNYTRLTKEYTGVLYLIPTVATNWKEFFGGMKMREELENMTPEIKEYFGITDPDSYMKWMSSIAGYQNGLIIDTFLEDDREEFIRECNRICEKMELKPLEIADGWVTLQPADDIYRSAKAALQNRFCWVSVLRSRASRPTRSSQDLSGACLPPS
jgi:hypothetical protein